MKQINLLPWREARRKEQQRQFAMFAASWVASAAALVLGAYLYVGDMIDAQEHRNAYLQEQIGVLDKSIASIKGLKQEKQRLTERMEIISELQSNRVAVVHMLDELVRVVPAGVYLTAMKQRGMTLEIEGMAQSNANVSEMMRQLDSAEWLGDPRLEVIESKDKRSSNRNSRFVLRVKHIIAQDDNRVEAG